MVVPTAPEATMVVQATADKETALGAGTRGAVAMAVSKGAAVAMAVSKGAVV